MAYEGIIRPLLTGATIHSADHDASDFIPNDEVSINVFRNRVIIRIDADLQSQEMPH